MRLGGVIPGRLGSWWAAHRSTALTLTGGGLVAAVVAVTSIVSTGFVAQRVDLGDGTVWLTSSLHQAAGRANPAVGELNGVLPFGSGSLDVVQQGSLVVVADRGDGEARTVDTATMTADDSFPLPPGEATVALTDDRAVIWSPETGSVWSVPLPGLAGFDPAATPDITVGPGGAMAVGDGIVHAVSPATGFVYSSGADPARPDAPVDSAAVPLASDSDVDIAADGSDWVVLDRGASRLLSPSGGVEVPLDDPSSAVLQSSSDARGVLVATSGTLYSVDAQGTVRTLSEGHAGVPARPLQSGGCVYAAWSDGSGYAHCGGTTADGSLADGNAVDAARYEGMASDAVLVYRTGGDGEVLLNDTTSGRAWDVTRDGAVIDDWTDLLDTPASDQEQREELSDTPEAPDPVQQPPVAVDDAFGARPDRSTVLPVLLNDYDVNGDTLVIDGVDVPDDLGGRVDVIADGRQLQLTLPADASGTLSFRYTVSDGRGGVDDAAVVVTVRGPGENSPPVQAHPSSLDVALGGRAETDIRSDWYDPDGDPFYLASAGVAAPDAVSFRPEGQVTYVDAGTATGDRTVSLVVSDGTATAVGSLAVRVHAPADVPLVADGFVGRLTVGVPATITPLEHVRGGTDVLRLTTVTGRDGVSVDADYVKGTVRVSASAAGTYLLDYSVADGDRTATGTIRLEVAQLPDSTSTPVTVPHAAFARQGTSVLVDVLDGDYDPAGGVLIVTSAGEGAVPEARVEVLEQRIVRVTLSGPLQGGRTTIGYTVSNGLASATGSIVVVEVPEPAVRQPPVAVPDTATVRVGDVVDVPVLANDSQPDGDRLSLHPELVTPLPEGAGLLFTSGSTLRYLAPQVPGEYTAEYRVDAPDGQWATARVTFRVREADAASNAPPVPAAVVARVVAGGTVRIPIPLTGIDPDGDSVQFAGLDSPPEKGTVTATGPSWIEYTAGVYSAGTDTVGYTVVDALGARASGTIRIGISPQTTGAGGPVATPDEVVVRPGRTVLVPVLANDSDPAGGTLRLVSVAGRASGDAAGSGASAAVSGDLVLITAPAAPGRYAFVYDVEDERGSRSSAFVTAVVTSDAPLPRPVVDDTVLTLDDVLDRDTLDVDVLAQVFFPEGPATQLSLSVDPIAGSDAVVTADKRIRVSVLAARQIIPFTVAHPDDPSVTASGFLWVPGTRDALPQLRSGAAPLVVQSGAELRIPLAEQVVVAGGGSPRITDPNTVRASHGDGSPLVASDTVLVFRSAKDWFGPASVSFEVADGPGPDARRATLVLPITVLPATNQPPVFTGARLELEPGQERTVDLTRLTTYPYPGAGNLLSYRSLDPGPSGFRWSIVGTTLTIAADPATPKGTAGSLGIAVADPQGDGRPGRLDLTVVASTRPLAVAAADSVIAPRGTTTTLDVLANDQAANPYPDVPLRVVAVRGVEAAALPDGVSIVPSADRSSLAITVSASAAPGDVTVQYQIADATGDPSRSVWGTARISVQDRPAPVTSLSVVGFGDREVDVAYAPGPANNSAITGFVATATTASGASQSTTCASTRCAVRTPGNGSSAAVSIDVVAVNGVGRSDPVALAGRVWSDVLPGPPGGLALTPHDGSIDARWTAAAVGAGGSPIGSYEVRVDGRLVQTVGACADSCTATVGGLPNGVVATVSVVAKNDAYPALAVWTGSTASAAATPFGAPLPSTLSATAVDGSSARDVLVAWPAFGDNGSAVTGYVAQLLRAGSAVPQGAQGCTVSDGRPVLPSRGGDVLDQQQTSAAGTVRFADLPSSSSDYSFVVWGWNAAGCTPTAVQTASVYPRPAVPSASVSMAMTGTDWDALVTLAGSADGYRIQRLDGTGAPVGEPARFDGSGFPRPLIGGTFGDVLRFRAQSCSVWSTIEICGDWSPPYAAPEPSVTTALSPPPQLTGSTFSWVAPPDNGDLPAAFSCGWSGSASATPAVGTTCSPAGPAVGAPWLDVTIAGRTYTVSGSKG